MDKWSQCLALPLGSASLCPKTGVPGAAGSPAQFPKLRGSSMGKMLGRVREGCIILLCNRVLPAMTEAMN